MRPPLLPLPVRQALDFGERPDPALGIFETLRLEGGALRMREAHLARMNASARELYGTTVTVPSAERGGHRGGRVRWTFVPGQGLRTESGPVGPDPVHTHVAPFVLPGGLGPHKWADRRLLDALTGAAAGALVLLIDSDGSVLEAAWANVLLEEGGRLVSPRSDGRTLPGIGRGRFHYDEEPVDLDRLLAADAVVLTSALRVVRIGY